VRDFHAFRWVGTSASPPGIAFAADLKRFAALSNGVHCAARSPSSIAAGPVLPPQSRRAKVLTVPLVPHSGQTFQVLGWLDADHVAALRRNRPGDAPSIWMRIDSVDVRTGHAEKLVDHVAFGDTQFATDLLSAPSSHAAPPPRPWDLRWTLGGLAFVLMTTSFFWWVMRRDRRA